MPARDVMSGKNNKPQRVDLSRISTENITILEAWDWCLMSSCPLSPAHLVNLGGETGGKQIYPPTNTELTESRIRGNVKQISMVLERRVLHMPHAVIHNAVYTFRIASLASRFAREFIVN